MTEETKHPDWLRWLYAGETLWWALFTIGGLMAVLNASLAEGNAFHYAMGAFGVLLPLVLLALGIVRTVRGRGLLTGRLAPAIQLTSSLTRLPLWTPVCLFLDVGNMAGWAA